MFSFSNKPQSVLNLLRDIMVLFIQSYLKMLPFFVVYIIAIVVSDSATYGIGHKTMTGLSALFSIIALIVHCYFSPVIFKKLATIGYQSPEKLKNILLVGIKKLPVIILNVFIAGLIILLPVLVLWGLLEVVFHLLVSVAYPLNIFRGGCILWMLFGAVFLTFLIPTIVFDAEPSIVYIRKVIRLIWGNWWHTFIFLLIISIPVCLLHCGFNFMLIRQKMLTGYWVTALLIIMRLILLPWFISAIMVVYNDLKLRKA